MTNWANQGRRRRNFNARIHARDRNTPGYVCPPCGNPINWDLAWPHVLSKSVDHHTELQDGGAMYDPANCWTAHLGCNSSKGATRAAQRRRDDGIIIGDIDSV